MARKDFKKNPAEMFISAAEEQQEAPQDAQAAGFTIPKGYRLEKDYKSERMQLLVRPATKKAIRALAAEQGLSMNDLVNNIFEEYLERQGKA